MNVNLRILLFILVFAGVTSCSTSKKSIVHRKSERKSARIKINPTETVIARVRDEVILEAIKHIGRDYRYGGKKPSTGFDCSGFVSYVLDKIGVNVRGASHQQARMGVWKSKSELEPGDLVFFGKGKKVSHVAIVIKNHRNTLEVIHSTSSSGVRIDNIHNSRYWNNRYLFSRDVIGEEQSFAGGK